MTGRRRSTRTRRIADRIGDLERSVEPGEGVLMVVQSDGDTDEHREAVTVAQEYESGSGEPATNYVTVLPHYRTASTRGVEIASYADIYGWWEALVNDEDALSAEIGLRRERGDPIPPIAADAVDGLESGPGTDDDDPTGVVTPGP